MSEELSARERIEAHHFCRDAERLAERVPAAAPILRAIVKLIRWMDEEIHRPEPLDY